MKTIQQYEVVSNQLLADNVFQIVLKGDGSWVSRPGQFMNITVKDGYLKRPISISDWSDDSLTLIYKVVGKGSEYLSTLKPSDSLEALVGLGNGFDIDKAPKEVLLIGGGVGTPPMYGLAKECLKAGKKVTVILGFTKRADVFYIKEFEDLGIKTYVSTNDGSLGTKGFVTDVMKAEKLENSYYFACGPLPMLKAIYKTSLSEGQMSFEERMGCGYGACMGCSHKTRSGYIRICTEGPVIESGEILWED